MCIFTGFGFVSFTDPTMGYQAGRDMDGKYVGSHPVTIKRSTTDVKPVVQKNDRNRGKKSRNNNNKEKKSAKEDDVLRAHTGAVIEKKAVKSVAGLKLLG